VGGPGDVDVLESLDAGAHHRQVCVVCQRHPRRSKEPHQQDGINPGCVVEYAHLVTMQLSMDQNSLRGIDGALQGAGGHGYV
jgi:hypothetical protein